MISQAAGMKRKLADNIKRVRDRMHEACARARRDPSEVTLVAVTKSVELDVIRLSLEMGLVELGESRAQQLDQRAAMLQEFLKRRQVLSHPADRPFPRPHWHMIGHLQTNKIRLVLPWCELIQSVDSLRLAEEIQQHAVRMSRDLHILLQVNTSGERSKFGVVVGAVPYMVEQLVGLERLKLRGLMTMAPLDAKPEEIRLYFERLNELFQELRQSGEVGHNFDCLSMGMSSDYPIAIEAGATVIRVGSALYEGLGSMPAAGSADHAL